jgi:superfamily II DNA or RNA helicase
MADQARGKDLFIVDNSVSGWTGLRYLEEWAEIAKAMDIATGYFEIGSLLALDGKWQKLDKIRILMGAETTLRTHQAILKAVTSLASERLDESIEFTKDSNPFLHGVPAILEAMRSGQIECKVYDRQKFHAKAYITHARLEVVGSQALVGSSNFTQPGLTKNIELNIQVQSSREVAQLQEWFEVHWGEAHEVTDAVMQIIERHTRLYSPFEIYAKALQQFFRGHELTAGEWENCESKVYPKLDQYQREGYQALMKIGQKYGGAFLCDGVGLGKTFIGLMAIERLVMHERKRVALFVPKSARTAVWEPHLRKYLPHVWGGKASDFSNLVVFSHTDLLRGGDYPDRFKRVMEMADAIVIDEAHNFRNPGTRAETAEERQSRYWQLYDICADKQVFMLTATPVNNRLLDLQHMIELFSQRDPGYFKGAPLGIHSLPGYFRKLEKELEQSLGLAERADAEGDTEVDQVEFERVLGGKELFREIVVQRSRSYVQESQKKYGGSQTIFPKRQDPQVVDYSVGKTYGPLLDLFEKAFNKKNPLFTLPMYFPLAYYVGPDEGIDPLKEGRQKQVVRLIRLQFLKRFESSPKAFEMSCGMLLKKLLAFVTKNSLTENERSHLERWKLKHGDLLGYVRHEEQQLELGAELDEEEDLEDDIISPEFLEAYEELPRDEYNVSDMLTESLMDLEQIAEFLEQLQKLKPKQDDKLQQMLKLLKTDTVLKRHKVIIFSEYVTTARYLRQQLQESGITGLDQVDSLTKKPRDKTIWQFAPYYNESSSAEIEELGEKETRVLISTDVLSEGLNLQDATRLINYDLHWNPVRLMQRIGRVDRRLNPDVEARILADHPEEVGIRQTVAFWNFLPPDELNRLLSLYTVVTQKTLRISRTFGIEGKKLLTPQDDYEALQDFIQAYEGTTTPTEEMRLEFQQLLIDDPMLADRLDALPGRVFSGKQHPQPGTEAVFFCYALPAPAAEGERTSEGLPVWSEALGSTAWYLYLTESGTTVEEPSQIIDIIRCQPSTPRLRKVADETLAEIKLKVEKHIRNTYLKRVDAPVGVRPILKCWMELNGG